MRKFTVILLGAGLAVSAVFLVTGCDKGTPATQTQSVSDSSGQAEATAAKTTDTTIQMAGEATEQTTCPVMGGDINKDYYTVYEGKKVYFCCPGCEEEFAKNPEKYIKDLPQFN